MPIFCKIDIINKYNKSLSRGIDWKKIEFACLCESSLCFQTNKDSLLKSLYGFDSSVKIENFSNETTQLKKKQ